MHYTSCWLLGNKRDITSWYSVTVNPLNAISSHPLSGDCSNVSKPCNK